MSDQPARRLGFEDATPRPDADGIAELVRHAHQPDPLDWRCEHVRPAAHFSMRPGTVNRYAPTDPDSQARDLAPSTRRPYTGADAHIT
jgi:hypothetical protein